MACACGGRDEIESLAYSGPGEIPRSAKVLIYSEGNETKKTKKKKKGKKERKKTILFSVMVLLIPPGCSAYRCTSSSPSMSISFCVHAVKLISAALLAQ